MKGLIFSLISLIGIFLLIDFTGYTSNNNENLNSENDKHHVTVYYEEGKFAGWPANWGMWSWNDEILVSFTIADHKVQPSHTFNLHTGINMFARSYDGGQTWTLEDAYENGITGATFEHNLGNKSEPSVALSDAINFKHPDFAFTFRAHTLRDGPTSFYYTYDRGQTWQGPFKLKVDFPPHNWYIEQPDSLRLTDRKPKGIVSRTDYVVESKDEMTAFITVGFQEESINWREVAVVRTTDAGLTWNHVYWITSLGMNSIMPSSLRLDEKRLLTTIRHTNPPRIGSYLSNDNGFSWIQLDDPVKQDTNSSPPALLKLHDGRLCLIYHIRKEFTMPNGKGIYAVFSSNEGISWSDPVLIRGEDGANFDIGYPAAIQRPDGKVVTTYYYNKANDPNTSPYRFIAATIFDPDIY